MVDFVVGNVFLSSSEKMGNQTVNAGIWNGYTMTTDSCLQKVT
jgi:hypothetical protein